MINVRIVHKQKALQRFDIFLFSSRQQKHTHTRARGPSRSRALCLSHAHSQVNQMEYAADERILCFASPPLNSFLSASERANERNRRLEHFDSVFLFCLSFSLPRFSPHERIGTLSRCSLRFRSCVSLLFFSLFYSLNYIELDYKRPSPSVIDFDFNYQLR